MKLKFEHMVGSESEIPILGRKGMSRRDFDAIHNRSAKIIW